MCAAFLVFFARRKVAPVHVRLTKKLANVMDGVDVSHARAGDILDVSDSQGAMLIAEAWAEPCDSPDSSSGASPAQSPHRVTSAPIELFRFASKH